jgi:UDP-N-acetylmuramoyl-tripeptide--D-alanyl-D-alanine ligase
MDAYNANPSSMEHAIDFFTEMPDNKKVLILGDMYELGEDSVKEHEHILDLVGRYNFNRVYLVGENFAGARGADKYKTFDNSLEAKSWFQEHPLKDCTVLIKGSRVVRMENILEAL